MLLADQNLKFCRKVAHRGYLMEKGHIQHADSMEAIWRDEALVRKLVDEVDMVYHLAAAVGVRLILERPVETIETNIVGTEMVLRAATARGPRHVPPGGVGTRGALGSLD